MKRWSPICTSEYLGYSDDSDIQTSKLVKQFGWVSGGKVRLKINWRKTLKHSLKLCFALSLAAAVLLSPLSALPEAPMPEASSSEDSLELQPWVEMAKNTPVDPAEYNEAITALAKDAGIDLSTPEDQTSLFQEIEKTLKEDVTKVKIESKVGLMTRLVLFGHKRSLYNKMKEIVERLSLPGEPNYTIKVLANPLPSAYINLGTKPATLAISLGLLAMAPNVDAFAGVIAHEMTHAHKEIFKGKVDTPMIDEVLNNMESYRGLTPEQREEIRADLGATHRLIEGGYNPWGMYDIEKNLTAFIDSLLDQKVMERIISVVSGKSAAYISTHPSGEIRMAAIKAYILHRGMKEDISENTRQYHKFDLSLKILKLRAQAITTPLTNTWVHRGIWAYLGYSVLSMVGLTDFEFARQIGEMLGQVTGPVTASITEQIKNGYHTLGELLAPVWEPMRSLLLEMAKFPIAKEGVDVFHAMMFGIWLGGTALSVDLLFYGIPISSEWKDLKILMKVNKNQPKLKKLTKYLIQTLHNEKLDPSIWTRILKLHISNYSKIEYLYNQNSAVYFYRWRDGLSRSQVVTSWNISRMLQAGLDYAETLSPNEKAVFHKEIHKVIEELPTPLLVKDNMRDLLEPFVGVQSVPNMEQLQSQLEREKVKGKVKLPGKLTLLRFAEERAREIPSGEQLKLANLLIESGFVSEARSIVQENYNSIYDFVFSSENRNPKLAEFFTKVVSQVQTRGTLGPPGRLSRLGLEQKITGTQLTGMTSAQQASEAKPYSATSEISYATFKWLSIRFWMQKKEKKSLQSFFENNFTSVSGLREFIETQLRPENTRLDQLSFILNSAIAKHPEWLQTSDDFEALIKSEYFWPTFQTEGFSPGSYESALVDVLKSLAKKYPETWKYEPASAEKLHHVYIQQLRAHQMYPKSFSELFYLWYTLTQRGITSATDEIFETLYRMAPANKVEDLETLALQGRVWENEIRSKMIKRRIYQSPNFKDLVASTDSNQRKILLEKVIEKLRKEFPETGGSYREILEEISQTIQSTPDESKVIHKAKNISNGERSEDFSLRVFSDFIKRVTSWSKNEQWGFILFLRGDQAATPLIEEAFRLIGPERVKRMFSLFPQLVRTQLLDSILDSPKGLIPDLKPNSGYGAKMIQHLLKDADSESRQIGGELLEAFMYALEATGNKALRSYVISYLYAMPKNQQSTGQILKSVLEVFGATGVKIGQFLAASQLLPEEVIMQLRHLQERANPPERETIYQDLSAITNERTLPVRIEKLLGSASLKYAVSAIETISKKRIVLKVLRIEAIANTRSQFLQLEKMAEYLTNKHGSKYGVFKAIVQASRAAVERELSFQGEVLKSKVMGQKVYKNTGGVLSVVEAPKEIFLSTRLIGAEFAEGTSIYEIPEKFKPAIASEILRVESENLFKELQDSDDKIIFDPDRHPGNIRVSIAGNGLVKIAHIDFGQTQTITKKQRDQVFEAFALSQILAKTGATDWAVAYLEKLFGFDSSNSSSASHSASSSSAAKSISKKVKAALSAYFPEENLREVKAYYSVLSALLEAGVPLDIVLFDFVKGIIQMTQYEEFMDPKNEDTPSKKFEAEVRKRADRLVSEMKLTNIEKIKIGVLRKTESNTTANKPNRLAPRCANLF